MWTKVTEQRYMEALEILPPALWLNKGFLLGEPSIHRECKLCGRVLPAFPAFVTIECKDGAKFYENSEPMTAVEFRALNPMNVLTSAKDAA